MNDKTALYSSVYAFYWLHYTYHTEFTFRDIERITYKVTEITMVISILPVRIIFCETCVFNCVEATLLEFSILSSGCFVKPHCIFDASNKCSFSLDASKMNEHYFDVSSTFETRPK